MRLALTRLSQKKQKKESTQISLLFSPLTTLILLSSTTISPNINFSPSFRITLVLAQKSLQPITLLGLIKIMALRAHSSLSLSGSSDDDSGKVLQGSSSASDIILRYCYMVLWVRDGNLGHCCSIFAWPFWNNCFVFTIWETKEEIIDWARDLGKQLGFVIEIKRSDNSRDGKKGTVLLGCERGGKFKTYDKPYKIKTTATTKLDCPFFLKGRFGVKINGWKLKVVSGFHNHKTADTLIGHPYAGRLSVDEKSLVVDMTNAGVKPCRIMLALKERFKENVSTMGTIYDMRQKIRREDLGSITEFQHLLKQLDSHQYHWWYRPRDSTDINGDHVLADLFMAHPKAVQLLNIFHVVLLIDNTDKTNKYKMSLLEIVGVTSYNETLNVGFALLDKEKIDNFVWALEKVHELLHVSKGEPSVIVTDRDLAMLQAVKNGVPSFKSHTLQLSHIKECRPEAKSLCSA